MYKGQVTQFISQIAKILSKKTFEVLMMVYFFPYDIYSEILSENVVFNDLPTFCIT